jgi:hypothetical protein
VDLANNGKIVAQGNTAQTAALVVTGLSLDRPAAVQGSTYTVTVAGSNLTAQTYFDVRVSAPGSSASFIANNWQTGAAASQSVPVGTPKGTWTITGVRAHQDPNNHTGSFVTVSVPLNVL